MSPASPEAIRVRSVSEGAPVNDFILEAFQSIAQRDFPSRWSSDCMQHAQQEALFRLAALKQGRQRRLRDRLAAAWAEKGPRRVCLSANLAGFDCRLPGVQVEVLDKGWFQTADATLRQQRIDHLAGAVVVVNNNDVGHNQGMAAYGDFYSRCEQAVFVAWDWDNHHWLELSTFLAAHSDVYAPAHHENLYLLSRYNPTLAGPVYCASVQWSRDFLAEHLPEILTAARSDAPLGKHIPYAPFAFRNRVVTTLGQRYPSIGFSDRSFHVRTPEERLAEWTAHKLHWIVPVLNDVPIRIFDALISGGIPVVPESLRHLAPVRELPREHVVFYGAQDVVDPTAVVARGVALFDRGGREGIAERHHLALNGHHGDQRVRQMLDVVVEQFVAAA